MKAMTTNTNNVIKYVLYVREYIKILRVELLCVNMQKFYENTHEGNREEYKKKETIFFLHLAKYLLLEIEFQ